jgi:hypothetical protein
MWKVMAEQVRDPKITTLDVKQLGPSAAREIGTISLKTKGSTPQEVTGKYVVLWEKVGSEWKLAIDIWNKAPVAHQQPRSTRDSATTARTPPGRTRLAMVANRWTAPGRACAPYHVWPTPRRA